MKTAPSGVPTTTPPASNLADWWKTAGDGSVFLVDQALTNGGWRVLILTKRLLLDGTYRLQVQPHPQHEGFWPETVAQFASQWFGLTPSQVEGAVLRGRNYAQSATSLQAARGG